MIGSPRPRDDRGAVAIVVAISTVVIFVLAALVVDLGLARDTRRESQNAADAAALAAANRLYSSGTLDLAAAADAARTYAEKNFEIPSGAWSTCTDADQLAVASTISPCISFDNATSPQRVRVRIPGREVNTPLGTMAGVSSVNVGSYAEAILGNPTAGPCGLCILGSGLHDFGTSNVKVTNTSVMMNGQLCEKKIFSVSPAPPNTLSIKDGVKTTQGCKTNDISPYPVSTGSTVTDPLASLAMPDLTGWQPKGSQNPCTGGPGIYTTFNNITNCTLTKGLYVVTGATSISGQHAIKGNEVTIYIACVNNANVITPCTSALSKNFNMYSQNTTLNLTAASAGSAALGTAFRAVQGVAILADRNWTGTLSFQGGGGGGTTQGAIYLKSGTMHYGGNTDGGVLDSMIVVDDFAGNGNSAELKVTNTGTNPPDAGPRSPNLYK